MAGISVFFIDSLGKGQMPGNIVGVFSGIFMAGMYISVGKTSEEENMSGILFGHLLTALIGIPFCFFTEGTVSVVSVISIIVLGVVQFQDRRASAQESAAMTQSLSVSAAKEQN
jgi:drug/metabolite transporter (DMT)-like permease